MTRMRRINADQPEKYPRQSAASASSAYLLIQVSIIRILSENGAYLK